MAKTSRTKNTARDAAQQKRSATQKSSQNPADFVLKGRAKTLALTGLFMSMFVSMLAMNVVGTSMPIIIADIGGTQADFTWVMTATMLASAISTPIWGKLADLTSKKMLLQLALIIFTIGSALAGLATDPTWLIGSRVFQGIGAGGLGALGQIVLAEIVSPLQRGKYMGIMGSIMAVSTVGGPLLGGFITDSIGWQWNFYVAAPVAIAAIIMLQRTLNLPLVKRKIKIDYAGAVFISAGFSSLLIWVTLGGTHFPWLSWETLLMVGGGIVMLIAAVITEMRAEEPLIPLTLFKSRTFSMAVIASLAVGLAMFGTAVFLGQYMQLSRGRTPTESGLLTIPMMAGVLLASTIAGQIITRTGKWKRYMVSGSIMLFVGMVMLGQLRVDTSYWYVGVSMFIMGAGVGMCMQNLVLVVQNTTDPSQMGVASSSVTFFRTIGGTAGMSAMGALLAHQVSGSIKAGVATLPAAQQKSAASLADGTIPKIADLSAPIRKIVETAYGHGVGDVFLAASPIALVAVIAIILIPNIPLRTQSNAELVAELHRQEAAGEGPPSTTTGSIPVMGEARIRARFNRRGGTSHKITGIGATSDTAASSTATSTDETR